jgi:hypothetical protein
MKVRELQQELGKLDPELTVLCYTEDEKLLAAGTLLRLMDIERVETTVGEQVRLADGTPSLKLGKSSASVTLATLIVMADF